jgi:hypothetical protein
MPLPPDFTFSQSSLQNYMDCQRRFELLYLQHLAWPALESEPVLEQERRMDLGHRFHQIIQQYILGFPESALSASAADPDLQRWWDHFLLYSPLPDLPPKRLPEYSLSAAFSGFRLLAKYDLVSVEPGQRAIILDWKTSLRRSPAKFLRQRLQTRLYPFLLVLAGAGLNGGQPLKPEQIEMIYWFAEFPTEPERIPYSEKQFQTDKRDIGKIIAEIQTRQPGTFMLTSDEKRCLFCNYRSLCNRGKRAGNWQQDDEDQTDAYTQSINLDFDQIGEIDF